MQLKEHHHLNIPPEKVYAALNDVEILRQSIPGCEKLEKKSDTEMTARVKLAIGPVRTTFTGTVNLSELDPPRGYTISGQGSGGAAGFAKGKATVQLTEQPDGGTLLEYTVEAQVGGKIAQLGARLIDGTAKKLAKQFFENFIAQLQPPETAENPLPPKNDTRHNDNKTKLFIIGGIVLLLIFAAVFA